MAYVRLTIQFWIILNDSHFGCVELVIRPNKVKRKKQATRRTQGTTLFNRFDPLENEFSFVLKLFPSITHHSRRRLFGWSRDCQRIGSSKAVLWNYFEEGLGLFGLLNFLHHIFIIDIQWHFKYWFYLSISSASIKIYWFWFWIYSLTVIICYSCIVA